MRVLTIDDRDDMNYPSFDCFAHLQEQSFRLMVFSGLDETYKELLVRGLREFADYIENSAEMKDSDVLGAGIRAVYKDRRLRGRGI